jgi:hypothetical protein
MAGKVDQTVTVVIRDETSGPRSASRSSRRDS